MTLEEKELRYEWLRSQQFWHEKKSGKWHRNQARWYKRIANHIFTFSEIISRTIKKRLPDLIRNIQESNALYKRLRAGK